MPDVSSRPAATIAPARRCAYAVVRRVFEQGAYADRVLHAQAAELQPRDRALAMRLSYGAVQRRGTVDHVIEQLAERPSAQLDPPLLAALRLGLFELLYLRGAPDYAVVADAVELAKAHARAGHGLVNAVMRRAAREGSAALLDPLREDTPAQAAIKHSHPEWIARLWWEALGAEQARSLMAYDNEPGEVALRANTLVTDAAGLARELPASTRADPGIPEALVLGEPLDLHGLPAWGRGELLAQSRAAMLVSRVLDPQPGERVLDLCAAPGGKSTHLAALMNGEGEVVAVERNRRRAGALARTASRLHADAVSVEVADARVPRTDGASFDRVLVDPPCSGLGTLQAHPDLRWRVSRRDVEEMAPVQAQILAAAATALRPGGVLVYATCTISPIENEHLVAEFLESHGEFDLDDAAEDRARIGHGGPPALADALAQDSAPAPSAGMLLTLPHRDRTAGFFIARMRRR